MNVDPMPATSTDSDLYVALLSGGQPVKITITTGADLIELSRLLLAHEPMITLLSSHRCGTRPPWNTHQQRQFRTFEDAASTGVVS